MLTFTAYLIEASLHKLDTMLRMPQQPGVQTGYVDARHILGPRANNEVVSLALSLVDDIKAKRIVPHTLSQVSIDTLIPTQHSVYFDDVADILRKQAFAQPIQVLRYKGHHYIINGHHRAAAAAVSDRDTIPAYVIAA